MQHFPRWQIEKNLRPRLLRLQLPILMKQTYNNTCDVMDEPYWIEQPTQKEDISLTLDNDIIHTVLHKKSPLRRAGERNHGRGQKYVRL